MSYDLREYLWIAVLGGIMGFLYGFLIGANDVANAFASSVSSKSITLKQVGSKNGSNLIVCVWLYKAI
jgi:sodium-dependent phosphate transporter